MANDWAKKGPGQDGVVSWIHWFAATDGSRDRDAIGAKIHTMDYYGGCDRRSFIACACFVHGHITIVGIAY
jgi:hypothetical protein